MGKIVTMMLTDSKDFVSILPIITGSQGFSEVLMKVRPGRESERSGLRRWAQFCIT